MPTLFKIQAATLPQPITNRPIFIRHLSRNDPFHSLPSNNLASQITPYAINIHIAQRAETAAEGRKVILRNVDVQTVSATDHGIYGPVVVLYTEGNFRFLQLSPTAPLAYPY